MHIQELATKQDLEALKTDLLKEFAAILSSGEAKTKEWVRSKEVRQLLGISTGTLQNLRIKRLLNPNKVEGVYYYRLSEIQALLNAGSLRK